MKSPAYLVVLLLFAMVNLSYGQGRLIILNFLALDKIYTNSTPGGQSTGQIGGLADNSPGSYTYGLFINTTLGTNSSLSSSPTPWTDSTWVFTGLYATNTLTPGGRLFSSNGDGTGQATINLPAPYTGLGAVGNNVNLELIGWNTAVGGADLNSFVAAYDNNAAGLYYGYSVVANVVLGNNDDVASPHLFGPPGFNLMTGFTLAPLATSPVPEPGSLVLAALGASSLLLLRRRR